MVLITGPLPAICPARLLVGLSRRQWRTSDGVDVFAWDKSELSARYLPQTIELFVARWPKRGLLRSVDLDAACGGRAGRPAAHHRSAAAGFRNPLAASAVLSAASQRLALARVPYGQPWCWTTMPARRSGRAATEVVLQMLRARGHRRGH
jgi:ABC-type protease/lipase transport system fused ATPase/permease subunit